MWTLGWGTAFEKVAESIVGEWMQVESPGKSDRQFTLEGEKTSFLSEIS
jgi:uncharacterized protein (DUF697 family)